MSNFWQKLTGNNNPPPEPPQVNLEGDNESITRVEEMDIALDDPLLSYLIQVANPVEVAKLNLKSPSLDRLRLEGVKVIVPLVSQGELTGLINLGARRSEQEYSSDDRRLLNTLATQAAPALRVAQLARQQQIEALERERIENELRVARVIQQTLLPKELPELPGWHINAFWQPAREVSGDFYDFLLLEDGRTCILIADVTDKGVPAAMVMATTRSLLRAAAERLIQPGKILERVNDLLHPDIPAKMFVTCLCVVLDPVTGEVVMANAGHNLPYHKTILGVSEPRASGMPLGLMPGMTYDEVSLQINPGDSLLMLSDGLVEGHDSEREMFGFERIKRIYHDVEAQQDSIQILMNRFNEFVGQGHEQEDDITLVTLTRYPITQEINKTTLGNMIAEFSIPSEPGNEREAAERVMDAVGNLITNETRRQNLETAVAEATMNAMEHGNHYEPDKPVGFQVSVRGDELIVHIRDLGGTTRIPEAEQPDIEAKLAGLQSPRGWGLFLIKNMVDDMNMFTEGPYHTMELIMKVNSNTGAE